MYRMTIALLALVNSLVAAYLHLWKTGRVGTLVCTASGGCETRSSASTAGSLASTWR